MAKFFEVLTVIEDDGSWTHGPYPFDAYDRAFTSIVVDVCEPATRPEPPDVALGWEGNPFAIIGNLVVPTRCSPNDLRALTTRAMAGATEYRISQMLWAGDETDIPKFETYLMSDDVTTVTRGADYAETVSKVLTKAYEVMPHIRPVLHLGFQAALVLQFGLQNLGIPFVVPPGYPIDAVAVTDSDIVVRLSRIHYVQGEQIDINRRSVELTRFASVEFDPLKAVRATS